MCYPQVPAASLHSDAFLLFTSPVEGRFWALSLGAWASLDAGRRSRKLGLRSTPSAMSDVRGSWAQRSNAFSTQKYYIKHKIKRKKKNKKPKT